MAYSDRMFLSPEDPEAEKAALELTRRTGPELHAALEEIGLYVDQKQLVTRDRAYGPPAAILISAVVGRVAFSDRVQRPAQEAVDELFDDMTERIVAAEFEERRRALDD